MAGCFAYVKWYDSCSVVFNICSGVRQGAVLSSILFAIYVDDIGKLCDPKHECVLLYAGDIFLISASVTTLQNLLSVCENELNYLDMLINSKKSSCISDQDIKKFVQTFTHVTAVR